MKKKILICGASGFVGTNVCKFFSKKNYKIIALYFKNEPKKKYKNIKYLKTDLRNFNNCLKFTKNIDILIQTAATTSGAKDIINQPYLHVTDNAILNSFLLKAAYINKVKHFIFTSCTVMYKNSNIPLVEEQVDEKKIFKPYFGVAHTKLYIEKMCKFFSLISNTKFTVIRHSNLFGPYDKYDLNKGHFFASSIVKVFNSEEKIINIFGDGEEKRDFLYIDDFLHFLNLAIKNQKEKFEIFNCSYGKSYKIIDILNKIIKFSKKNKKIKKNTNAKSLKINISVKSQRALKILGWKKKININQAIKKTINWYVKNYKIF